jgi:hypothetical protein
MNSTKDYEGFVPRKIMSLRRMAGTALMTVAMLFANVAVSATYNFQITDPMMGASLTDLNTVFWEPWIGSPGNAGASEQGYVSISDEGLVLGSFNVNLGVGPGWVPKWVLDGDFRVSFFLEISSNPGDFYGNRLTAYVNEMAPLCGALNPNGFAGLWMGYSGPPTGTYYELSYNEAAYFLFVKEGETITIYKGDSLGVTEGPDNQVFFGNYLNPEGQFVFDLGTGNPNSGWMRVRDVVIDTEGLLACDGSTPIPPEWNVMENDTDGDGVDNDVDNCPEVANTNQDDFDGNGVGDGCDEDVDGDGVLNAVDACPLTPLAEVVSRTGCAITQLCPCTGPRGIRTAWKNHGAYVSCVAQATGNFVKLRLITLRTALHQVSAAAQSKCGK